jgi:pimeloyl-ACP methyl ester carboxylesterase
MAKMPKTIALPDKILLSTAKPGTSHTGTSYLIFFVPGNPGVIEYYRSFLTLLYKQVAELADNHQGRVRIDVLGASLNGFQCTPRHTNELKQLPIDMDGQVEFAEAALKAHCKTVLGLQGAASHEPVRVILIGHSMGGYLAMEMLRRHHSHVELGRRVQIDGVVGICPSLVHLARSEGGLKHSVSTSPTSQIDAFRLRCTPTGSNRAQG